MDNKTFLRVIRRMIREEVRNAFKDELRDVLLELAKPRLNDLVTEDVNENIHSESTILAKNNIRDEMRSKHTKSMVYSKDNAINDMLNETSQNMGSFGEDNPGIDLENGSLPASLEGVLNKDYSKLVSKFK